MDGTEETRNPLRNAFSKFLGWRFRHKHTFNLIALVAFLIILPLFADNSVAQVFIDILIVIVLFFAIHAISGNRIHMLAGLLLAGIAIILDALYFMTSTEHYFRWSLLVALAFFGVIAIIIFLGVIREKDITPDTIAGALSVYFLIGIMWAFAIMAMYIYQPGSFATSKTGAAHLIHLSDFIGYSFSILTTTGNYEIGAVTSTARMVTMFEMITGTLYIAVLISWLVGRFLGRKE